MSKAAPYNRTREKNPFWKGGRSIASNGYVLVKVGVDHHLADVRGYAYEHRIEGERKLGRRLLPGEVVHHIDGNKQNNAPDNLEVMQDAAHHRVEHRIRWDLRQPGEPNKTVFCACGCGAQFELYDQSGRPREYVSGHNPPASPTMDALVAELAQGFANTRMLALRTGRSRPAVSSCLSKLKQRGLVKLERGIWSLQEGGARNV